ncbi:MAG: imidazole glycerol phosphate synthase subunit HisH [Candidatus Gracilibacteria bacterium]|jgi:glutamine amidotransferase
MIQIIDYGAGNIKSVQNALKQLDIESKVISSAKELQYDCKTIFPGVGAAGAAMQQLEERGFITEIPKIKAPFLGICLGMQLLMDFSEENNVYCLKIIKGMTRRFSGNIKIPQIGWNKVEQKNLKNSLFENIPDKNYFYFVNSYYVDPVNKSQVIGTTDYGINFASVIKKQNFYGVQFHPEKSGEIGLELLNNFCKLC